MVFITKLKNEKLLLISALLIFACSSDGDDNNNSNQTFLERYDGVVWEEDMIVDYLESLLYWSNIRYEKANTKEKWIN